MLTNYCQTVLGNLWLEIEYDNHVDKVIIVSKDLPNLLEGLLKVFGKEKIFEVLGRVV